MLVITNKTFKTLDWSDGNTLNQDGCVGDKYKCTINLYWQKGTENMKVLQFSAADKTITNPNYTRSLINIIGGTDGLVSAPGGIAPTSPDTEGFVYNVKLFAGEKIKFPGSANNTEEYTIESVTDSVIKTVEDLNDETCNSMVYVTSKITAIDFLYNFIGTNDTETYFSLTDPQSQQKYVVTGLDAGVSTPINMLIGTPSFAWVTDTVTGTTSQATIAGAGITSDFKQQFTILHTYFITPLATPQQIKNFNNLIYPPYFAYGSRLKYICSVNAYYDPSVYTDIVDTGNSLTPIGQTSWVNENSVGTAPEFTMNDISYMDNMRGTIMTQIDFTKNLLFTLKIKSASGLFVSGTRIVVCHIYIPTSAGDYQNTATTLRQNFMHDRLRVALGGTAQNGEFNGTNYQIFQNVSGVVVDANNATITGTINYAPFLKNLLSQRTTARNYLILATVEQ